LRANSIKKDFFSESLTNKDKANPFRIIQSMNMLNNTFRQSLFSYLHRGYPS